MVSESGSVAVTLNTLLISSVTFVTFPTLWPVLLVITGVVGWAFFIVALVDSVLVSVPLLTATVQFQVSSLIVLSASIIDWETLTLVSLLNDSPFLYQLTFC